VNSIDGVDISNHWGTDFRGYCTYELLPGPHTIKAMYSWTWTGGGYIHTQTGDIMDVTFIAEAGHEYLLRADFPEKDKWVLFVDDATEKQKIKDAVK